MHRIDRNDRVRLLALTWADSLPAAAVSNWEANVRSSEKLDRVVSAVIQRNEYGMHAEFEKAYEALTGPLRAAVTSTYVQGGPKSEASEKGIQRIAAMMPRYVRVPYEVMQNADVILARIKSVSK
jgi:hypothetical protein